MRWVLSCSFRSEFYTLSSSGKNFENRLRFDKVTESLQVGRFLRHSVEWIIIQLSELVQLATTLHTDMTVKVTIGVTPVIEIFLL